MLAAEPAGRAIPRKRKKRKKLFFAAESCIFVSLYIERGMTDPLHISEAASIALHTALWLAKAPAHFGPGPAICKDFGFSPAHFAKVIQILVRAGLVETVRGPAGGVRLAHPPSAIALLNIYEAVEGPVRTDRCLLDPRRCRVVCCPIGRDLTRLRREFRRVLSQATLEQVAAATDRPAMGLDGEVSPGVWGERKRIRNSQKAKKGKLG